MSARKRRKSTSRPMTPTERKKLQARSEHYAEIRKLRNEEEKRFQAISFPGWYIFTDYKLVHKRDRKTPYGIRETYQVFYIPIQGACHARGCMRVSTKTKGQALVDFLTANKVKPTESGYIED